MNVIILVADELSVSQSVKAALPETDLVICESSVDQALRRVISTDADVILLDDSPRFQRDALSRFSELKPNTPVIVLSSRGNTETLAALRLDGAFACVVKPFSCETLKNAMNSAIAVNAASGNAAIPETDSPQNQSPVTQHRTALRWLGRTFSHIKNPFLLGQSLVDATADIFDTLRSAVLLETDGKVKVAASNGISKSIADSVLLGYSTGLMRWFDEHPQMFDRDALDAPHDASKEMQVLGARLAAPLLCEGRVCGAILIGEKASGSPFTLEDRELLTTVARCASISLENARHYEDSFNHKEHLDSVLAHVPSGVITVKADKTISMMNSGAERILQLKAQDMVGRSVQKLGSAFADVVLRTMAGQKPQLRKVISDPAINATLGLSATPLAEDGVVVVFSAIPEEKETTEDLNYSPFWEYLSSRIAQEIKNPMVAVNTFAQLLPKKYNSEDFREAFSEVVQKEVSRINAVVETLFDFARRPRLIKERASLNESMQSVLHSFEAELRRRSIKIDAAFDPALPQVDLDPILFAQAVHNVVQNSIEAMPSGGTLKVSTSGKDEQCELVVADTGPGISDQDADLIFMPFFSTKEKGMGLGLTVANKIMRQHDGDLKLLDDRESGGAFAFYLPKSSEQNG